MLRLEVLMEGLLAEHASLADTEEALAAALDDVRGQGYVALKSIAAYRTGLDIREWSREEVEESFREYKRIDEAGPARLVHKPLARHPVARGLRAGGATGGSRPVPRGLR